MLSIFLLAIMLWCLFCGCQAVMKEPFYNCNTLRCTQNKYSATSIKSHLKNKLTDISSDHIANAHSYISDLKEKWL